MLRHRLLLLVSSRTVALGFLLFTATDAFAFDEDSAAADANKGFHLGLGPVLLVPTESNRPLGGGSSWMVAMESISIPSSSDPAHVSPGI
jgi:hypothetical protein